MKPKVRRKRAASTAKDPAAAKPAAIAAKPVVAIDYPQLGETVTSSSYSIRIGAPEAAEASVSINDGPWQPCRCAAGYWWYDWAGYLPGQHQIKARILTKDGKSLTSLSRQFSVRLTDPTRN